MTNSTTTQNTNDDIEQIKYSMSALDEKMDALLKMIEKLDRKTAPYKKPKKVKIEGEPKRPLSAYFFFQADIREETKAANPDMQMGQLAKKMGELWGNVDVATKETYNVKAKADKARYTEEKAAFDAGREEAI
jgi:hypothetical protein